MRRAWLAVWNADFTSAEAAAVERVMGAVPAGDWTRREMPGAVALRMERDDALLGYSRDTTERVFGRVGRLERVDLGRNRMMWVTDLEHLASPIESLEHARAYADIRRAITVPTRMEDGPLPKEVYRTIVAAIRRAELMYG